MQQLMEYRVRSKISEEELQKKVGRIVTDDDYNILLTGPTRVVLPSGEPLCIYLPKAIDRKMAAHAFPILQTVDGISDSRAYASGSQPAVRVRQHVYRSVPSSIIGSIGPHSGGRYPYCRQTAWTGRNTEQFQELYPLFETIAGFMKEHVQHRYEIQMERVLRTHPHWRIGQTPYTTMTVNNTYPTGVHQDAGDLAEGFSCLMCIRRGNYAGGYLTFPEYRIAVNMQDGDLLLMDAHQWHGNTNIVKLDGDAERISLVLYYRTKMEFCGTAEEEAEKERLTRQKRIPKVSKEQV
jgi:hypothetical protein